MPTPINAPRQRLPKNVVKLGDALHQVDARPHDAHAARAARDGISRDEAKQRTFAETYGIGAQVGGYVKGRRPTTVVIDDFVAVGQDDPTIVGYPRTRERRFNGLVAVLVGSLTWLGLAIGAGWFFAWVMR
jgi:hypothetical protein